MRRGPRYIDSNFKENISLDQLAELTHVNKYYLVHSFSKEYGVSPINYLIGRRIEESRHLGWRTPITPCPRSPHAGFFLPSYFSQSFRKLEGISPMEYQEAQRAARERDIRNNNSCNFCSFIFTIVRML